ncbi:UNVERIFIED_CONTAM: hypothetical protein K2H54_015941 [Gekko kuhli]
MESEACLLVAVTPALGRTYEYLPDIFFATVMMIPVTTPIATTIPMMIPTSAAVSRPSKEDQKAAKLSGCYGFTLRTTELDNMEEIDC